MPIPIQNAEAWRKLQAIFGITGRHKLQLDEVVIPVVSLDPGTVTSSPKTGGDVVAAVAAEQGVVGISNPAGSGTILFVRESTINGSGEIQLRFNLATVGLTVGGPSSTRDFRQPTSQVTGQLITGTDPGPIGTFTGILVAVQAALSQTYQLGWVLPPGTNIAWVGTTPNVVMRGYFLWDEYAEDQFSL
ncbi:MAG: hypothetical protein ABFS23_11150 [Pseudomonadota bacterium]